MGRSKMIGLFLSVMLLVGLWAAPAALAQEKPQKGGVLRVALAGDPPSLDMHQEQTFLVTIPMSTVYNTLVMFDPHGYPKIIGDLAKSWTVSDDNVTWTFTLHQGVTFHDGSELTSADVKASLDKIVFPPEGVVSPRKSYFQMMKRSKPPIATPWSFDCTILRRRSCRCWPFLPTSSMPKSTSTRTSTTTKRTPWAAGRSN